MQATSRIKSKQDLLHLVKEAAYLEGDFTTRAGKKTSYYIDKYLFETRPDILESLAHHLLPLLPPSDTYDRIAAPELGAVSIAAVLSVVAQKPFVIVRKANKDYGTQKMIEGTFNSGEKVVIVEDILTTGGAALAASEVLLKEGATVLSIVGVVNREEGAIENILAKGFEVEALYTSSELKAC